MKKIASALIILICVLLTLFFASSLDRLVLSGDFTALFPWDEITDVYEGGVGGQTAALARADDTPSSSICTDYIISSNYRTSLTASAGETIGKDETYTSTMYVLVYSENLYDPDFLDCLEECIDSIDSRRDSARPSSVLDWFTLRGEDGYMAIGSMSPDEDGKWTEEEAAELRSRIGNDPIVPYYLVGGSGNSFILQFIYADKASEEQIESLSSVFDSLREKGARVILMSNMVISGEVMKALKKDLYVLASLALLLMIVVYFLSFRTLRAVVLPLLLSVISLIWTLGTMALLGIELNLLSILTPCLVLILGSTYSMHMLNEYYLSGKDVIVSSKHIIMTIALGALTTALGFLALSFAPSHTLYGFGISVAFGVFYSALLAVFCLPSFLILLPRPKKGKGEKLRNGILQRIINSWSRTVVRIWPWMIVLFSVIAVVFFLVKDRISVDSNYMSYFAEDDEFGIDCRFFSKEIGGTTPFTVTITAPEGEENFFLDKRNLDAVFSWEEHMRENRHVLQIISFPQYVAFASREILGSYSIPSDEGVMSILRSVLVNYADAIPEMTKIVSSDFNTLTITVQTWDGDREDLITTTSVSEVYTDMVSSLSLLPEGTKVSISGYPIISAKFSSRLISDQKISTLLSMASILIVASLFLLSFSRGLLVLVPVTAGIMINYIFMYLFSIPFDIITVSFSSIAVGCGVDDALHFSLRYRRFEKKLLSPERCIEKAVKNTGRPIVLTTLSIVSGMLMLSFGSYVPIRYFGVLMSVTLMACMLSTLVFLPSFALFFDFVASLFDGRAFRKGDGK